MPITHPHETLLETLSYNGISAELVQWQPAIWCGSIVYAENNTDEPNVEAALNRFMSLPFEKLKKKEDGWDICFSLNYLSANCPNGVMFGFLTDTEEPSDEWDTLKTPAALYIRIELSEKIAAALDENVWEGGIPPYEWIGEKIAPAFGYSYGSDSLPIVEYYGFYDAATNAHKYRYLYVPVEKKE